MNGIRRLLAVFLSAVFILSAAVIADAEYLIDRIDFRVNSNIAGLTYVKYDRIFSVENEGFYYLYSPVYGSALTAYKDGRSFSGRFEDGEEYLLNMNVFYPGEMPVSEDLKIYANGQQLSYEKSEYRIVYNPDTDRTLIGISFSIVPDDPKVINGLRLDVRTDIAGLTAGDYEEIITAELLGTDYICDPKSKIRFFVYENDQARESGQNYIGRLAGGKTYRLSIEFEYPYSYDWSSKAEVTVNGENLQRGESNGNYYYNMIFTGGYINKNTINVLYNITVDEQSFSEKLSIRFKAFFQKIRSFFMILFDAVRSAARSILNVR